MSLYYCFLLYDDIRRAVLLPLAIATHANLFGSHAFDVEVFSSLVNFLLALAFGIAFIGINIFRLLATS